MKKEVVYAVHYVQPHQSEGHSINGTDKPLRPSSPHCTASLGAINEALCFCRPDFNTKMHAINFECICYVLEIIGCDYILTHFVTQLVALFFYITLRHATEVSHVK